MQVEYDLTDFDDFFQTELLLIKKRKVTKELSDLIKSRKFDQADDLFKNQPWVEAETYARIKSDFLISFFNSREIDLPLEEEQLKVITPVDDNFLVSARAGSGKTRVISAKIVRFMKLYGLPADKILALAFNKSAALQIGDRVKKITKSISFNTRTFHSLAYNIIRPKKILYDQNRGDQFTQVKELSLFVQNLVKQKTADPIFLSALIQNFRQEVEELSNIGLFRSPEEYYLYRRSLVNITLSGHYVKSRGEKFIADFLFEHDIPFIYEKYWDMGGSAYRRISR